MSAAAMVDSDNGGAAAVPGLGQRLAAARERRGLGVLQAAEKLHLEPRVVEALEAEDFDSLGAAVYVRGHLQRYAELLGENAAELQSLYAALAHAHTTPDLTQVITERNRAAGPGGRVGAWQGGLLTLALVLAALVWWAVRSGPLAPPTGGPAATPSPAGTNAGTAAGVSGEAAPQAARGAPAAAISRTAAPRANPAAPRSAPPVVELPPATTPAPAAVTAPAAAAPQAAPIVANAPAAATTGAAATARVVLRFKEDSWAEVYDADGNALYRDIAAAGAVHELSGTPPLRVVLGNAAGVGISIDGRNVSLGAALQATPNVRFSLDRGGRVTESP